MIYVLAYLFGVVAANVSLEVFGPRALVINAFLLVGLTITTRDRLHDMWGDRVRVRMVLLVLAGGVLSLVLAAPRIAAASFVAFVVSETVDFLVYSRLRQHRWLVRSNASNVSCAVVDSLLFPVLVYGAVMPLATTGMVAAKTAGGALWSVLLRRVRGVAVVCLLAFVAAPVQAQIVSLGAGLLATRHAAEPTLELFAATPPLKRLRLSAVVATDDEATVAFVAKLGYEALRPLSIEAGANWLRFRDYRPEPFVGVFLKKRFAHGQLGLAFSVEVNTGEATTVLKYDFWTYFKK